MPRLFSPAIFQGPGLFDTSLRVVVVIPTLASVLAGSHTPVARLEFLEADLETVKATIDGRLTSVGPLLNGSVTTDRSSDTYSSASISVVNEDGLLTPGFDALIWSGRPVRVSRGAMVGMAPTLKALITGVIADPQDELARLAALGRGSGAVSFTVASRFALAKRQFPGPTTIPAGIRGKDAIRQLLELGGLGTSDSLYDMTDNNYTVPVARTFDVNDEILGSAVKWAFDMNCELWPDGAGVTRMEPFVDPATITPLWDFGSLLELGRTIRSRQLYNRQDVFGRGLDGYTISATAKITNPGDPLYWTTALDLPAPPYRSDDLHTVDACLAVARRLLAENATYEETLNAAAIPVPLVRAGNTATFSGAGRSESFILDSCTIPVYHGSMRMVARRSRA